MIPPPAYITSGPHLSGYRVTLGYETLAEASEAHALLAARHSQPGAEGGVRDPSRLWASDMTDAEVSSELAEVDAALDRLQAAAADGEELGGGSPGEGLYERHDELTREMAARRASPQQPATSTDEKVGR